MLGAWYGMHYYKGNGNRLLNALRNKYGILLCKDSRSDLYSVYEDSFMYYDPVRNREIYKTAKNRKSIRLSLSYYDYTNKIIVDLKNFDTLNKKFSNKFFEDNFVSADSIDIEALGRTLKLKKIVNRITNK